MGLELVWRSLSWFFKHFLPEKTGKKSEPGTNWQAKCKKLGVACVPDEVPKPELKVA